MLMALFLFLITQIALDDALDLLTGSGITMLGSATGIVLGISRLAARTLAQAGHGRMLRLHGEILIDTLLTEEPASGP